METINEAPGLSLHDFVLKLGGADSVFRILSLGRPEGYLLLEQFVQSLDRLGYSGNPYQDFLDIDTDCDGRISLQDISEYLQLLDTYSPCTGCPTPVLSDIDLSSASTRSSVSIQSVRMELQELRLEVLRIQEDQQAQQAELLDVLTRKLTRFSMASMVQNAVDQAVTKYVSEHMAETSVALRAEIREFTAKQAQEIERLQAQLDKRMPDKEITDAMKKHEQGLDKFRVELQNQISKNEITESIDKQSMILETLRMNFEQRMSHLERRFGEVPREFPHAKVMLAGDTKKISVSGTPCSGNSFASRAQSPLLASSARLPISSASSRLLQTLPKGGVADEAVAISEAHRQSAAQRLDTDQVVDQPVSDRDPAGVSNSSYKSAMVFNKSVSLGGVGPSTASRDVSPPFVAAHIQPSGTPRVMVQRALSAHPRATEARHRRPRLYEWNQLDTGNSQGSAGPLSSEAHRIYL